MKHIIKVITVFLLSVFVLSGCKNEDQMRDDINYTLKEICAGRFNNGAYIYSFENDTGNNGGLINDEDINRLFLSKIKYKINSLSKENDNKHGAATITFTFPDLLGILDEAAGEMNNEADTEALLSLVAEKLQGDFEKKKQEVSVDMVYAQSHWYIIPNADLSNVLSGGLLEYYSSLGKKYIESKTEGESR